MTASRARVFAPETPAAAAEVLLEAARTGERVAFAGGGTHAAPPAEVETILRTSGLRRVLEYAPEDQTVTVEAGIAFAELERVLAARRQRLALEVADPERATIGGAIAANASGPRRLAYGTMKDLILGVGLVRADGASARAGGKVVKNVAGFDLSKLVVGSFGSLALVTEATLRVHPLPEAAAAFRLGPLDAAGVWELVTSSRERRLDPTALVAHADGASRTYDVLVLVEGFAAGVTSRAALTRALAAERDIPFGEIEVGELLAADAARRGGGPLRARIAVPAATLAALDAEALAPLAASFDDARALVDPSAGVAVVSGAPRSPEATALALGEARAWAERRGGSLVIERRPEGVVLAIDRWGTPPAAFALMRALKSRFDPQARLAPGTFVGGL